MIDDTLENHCFTRVYTSMNGKDILKLLFITSSNRIKDMLTNDFKA